MILKSLHCWFKVWFCLEPPLSWEYSGNRKIILWQTVRAYNQQLRKPTGTTKFTVDIEHCFVSLIRTWLTERKDQLELLYYYLCFTNIETVLTILKAERNRKLCFVLKWTAYKKTPTHNKFHWFHHTVLNSKRCSANSANCWQCSPSFPLFSSVSVYFTLNCSKGWNYQSVKSCSGLSPSDSNLLELNRGIKGSVKWLFFCLHHEK